MYDYIYSSIRENAKLVGDSSLTSSVLIKNVMYRSRENYLEFSNLQKYDKNLISTRCA